ncbi:hypothetical protein J4408_03570 [Candidatus Pacearchaeota archaeon]|nr:hypothetical protein [Candidatus Pacearchaeota archaeon]
MEKANLLRDFRNNLLKRREIKLVFTSEKNPGFDFSAEKIASQFKTDKDLIVIRNVKSKFGRDTFLVDAFVYDSKKDKERVEPKPKIKKTTDGGAK